MTLSRTASIERRVIACYLAMKRKADTAADNAVINGLSDSDWAKMDSHEEDQMLFSNKVKGELHTLAERLFKFNDKYDVNYSLPMVDKKNKFSEIAKNPYTDIEVAFFDDEADKPFAQKKFVEILNKMLNRDMPCSFVNYRIDDNGFVHATYRVNLKRPIANAIRVYMQRENLNFGDGYIDSDDYRETFVDTKAPHGSFQETDVHKNLDDAQNNATSEIMKSILQAIREFPQQEIKLVAKALKKVSPKSKVMLVEDDTELGGDYLRNFREQYYSQNEINERGYGKGKHGYEYRFVWDISKDPEIAKRIEERIKRFGDEQIATGLFVANNDDFIEKAVNAMKGAIERTGEKACGVNTSYTYQAFGYYFTGKLVLYVDFTEVAYKIFANPWIFTSKSLKEISAKNGLEIPDAKQKNSAFVNNWMGKGQQLYLKDHQRGYGKCFNKFMKMTTKGEQFPGIVKDLGNLARGREKSINNMHN